MKQIIITVSAIVVLATTVWLVTSNTQAKWSGVDESVVEKFAKEAGRSTRKPYINTDQGDLLLFVFLIAGSVGGFIAGYTTHKLFMAPQEPLVSYPELANRGLAGMASKQVPAVEEAIR